MLKKLTCNHKYNLYHISSYIEMLTNADRENFHYICPKCGKTSKLDSGVVDSVSKNISIKVSKEKAKGEDHSEYKDEKFCLMHSIYSGKSAYYINQKYYRYKQAKAVPLLGGLDLNEINDV